MPVGTHTFASGPPAPPTIAAGRPEPERAAVQAAASPAEAERLGDRIAELASRIYAATYELLVLIREFDAAGAWSGFSSCAVWLSWRTGLEPGAAREHVRVAHALAQLPKVSDAMRRGRVSYSKVRAITRVATPETEQSLLDVALAGTAAHVERVVRAWRRVDRAAEANDDRAQQAGRTLHTWVDDDGIPAGAGGGGGGGRRRDGGRREGEDDGRGGRGGRRGAEPRTAAGGCAGPAGRVRAGRRAGPGDGGRPLPGGAARGRRDAGRRCGAGRAGARRRRR